mmetsp:Transcript_37654/g.67172  ORF Transcript_37654/g.67172 Transcript_37654/m.67172 type:complete len:408 (-) Transcript_37654:9-1232(-)
MYCPYGHYSPRSVGYGNQYTQLINMVELAAQSTRLLVLYETQFCWARWGLVFDMAALAVYLESKGSGLRVVDVAEITENAHATGRLDRHLKKPATYQWAAKYRCLNSERFYCQRFDAPVSQMNRKCTGSRKNACVECIIRAADRAAFIPQQNFVASVVKNTDPVMFMNGFTAFTLGSASKVRDIDWARKVHVPLFHPSIRQHAEVLLSQLIGDQRMETTLASFQLRTAFCLRSNFCLPKVPYANLTEEQQKQFTMSVTKEQSAQICDEKRASDSHVQSIAIIQEIKRHASQHNCTAVFIGTDNPEYIERHIKPFVGLPIMTSADVTTNSSSIHFDRSALQMSIEIEILSRSKILIGTMGSSIFKVAYLRRQQDQANTAAFCCPQQVRRELCGPHPDYPTILREYHGF